MVPSNTHVFLPVYGYVGKLDLSDEGSWNPERNLQRDHVLFRDNYATTILFSIGLLRL